MNLETLEELLAKERELEGFLLRRDYGAVAMAILVRDLNNIRRKIADINYARMAWENDEEFIEVN